MVAAVGVAACSVTAGHRDRPSHSPVVTAATTRPRPPELAALERRPLRLPRTAGSCPASAIRQLSLTWNGPTGGVGGFATRQGPLVLLLSEESIPLLHVRVAGKRYIDRAVVRLGPASESGWSALKTVWLSRPSYRGPALVRGRQLGGSAVPGIGGGPGSKRFVLAAGPDANGGDGYRPGIAYVWLRHAGCYGFQVDGTTFSHDIVVDVLPRHGPA